MAGILLRNYRTRNSAEVGGRTRSTFATESAVIGGKLLKVSEGREQGSRVDGSKYVVAHVQVVPGTKIRVAAYGDDQIAKIKELTEGEDFPTAILSDMMPGRDQSSAYKFVRFDEPTAQAATA